MAKLRMTVPSAEFLDAVSKLTKMKRGPKGSRGSIPTDTVISRSRNGEVYVETPVAATRIGIKGEWADDVSIDARTLMEKTKALLGPRNGVPNVTELKLWASPGRLHMKGLAELWLPVRDRREESRHGG